MKLAVHQLNPLHRTGQISFVAATLIENFGVEIHIKPRRDEVAEITALPLSWIARSGLMGVRHKFLKILDCSLLDQKVYYYMV